MPPPHGPCRVSACAGCLPIRVVVPRLARVVVHVNVAHAALDEATRQQTAVAKRRRRRTRSRIDSGSRAHIEESMASELHAERRLHRGDAAFEICVLRQTTRRTVDSGVAGVESARCAVSLSVWFRRFGIIFSGSTSALLKVTP